MKNYVGWYHSTMVDSVSVFRDSRFKGFVYKYGMQSVLILAIMILFSCFTCQLSRRMGDGFDGNLVLFLVRALMLPTVALLIGFLFDGGRMGGIVGVQLVCVATFALALCVAYYVIASDAPIAFSSANGLKGVVSLYEARYVNILCVLGLSVQLFVVCFENMYQSAKMAVGGVLAVVSLLLPRLLESYEFAQAIRLDRSDEEYKFVAHASELSLSAALSLSVVFVLAAILPSWGVNVRRWIDSRV